MKNKHCANDETDCNVAYDEPCFCPCISCSEVGAKAIHDRSVVRGNILKQRIETAAARAMGLLNNKDSLPKYILRALEVKKCFNEMAILLGPNPRFLQEEEDAIKEALLKAFNAGENSILEKLLPIPEEERCHIHKEMIPKTYCDDCRAEAWFLADIYENILEETQRE